jgi:hypothetical protein
VASTGHNSGTPQTAHRVRKPKQISICGQIFVSCNYQKKYTSRKGDKLPTGLVVTNIQKTQWIKNKLLGWVKNNKILKINFFI